jgi:hypothetical protein
MALHFAPLNPALRTAQPAARSAAASTRQVKAAGPAFRAAQAAADPPAVPAPAASNVPSILSLFAGKPGTNAPAAVAANPSPPTAEQVFGPNPWLENPTGMGPDGSIYGYNPQYFATPQTAAMVAKMVGGTVVQSNELTSAPGSHFMQQQPNQMVRLANGTVINPGLVATFYTHGYPQSMVDQMIANEVGNTST